MGYPRQFAVSAQHTPLLPPFAFPFLSLVPSSHLFFIFFLSFPSSAYLTSLLSRPHVSFLCLWVVLIAPSGTKGSWLHHDSITWKQPFTLALSTSWTYLRLLPP